MSVWSGWEVYSVEHVRKWELSAHVRVGHDSSRSLQTYFVG